MEKISLLRLSLLFVVGIFVLTACSPVSDADKDTKKIQLSNNKQPIAIIADPTSEQFIVIGDTINFIGHGSFDPDANVPLTFSWNFTGAETSIRQTSEHNTGLVTFSETGVAIAHLVVTDSLGAVSEEATIKVNISASDTNRPPNGAINYRIGNGLLRSGDLTVTANTIITFSGSASDEDSDPVNQFDWDMTAGVVVTDTPGSTPFNVSFPTVGTYIIALTVTDDTGNTDLSPARVAVTVVDAAINRPPDGFITHDNGNGTPGTGNISIAPGQSVIFTADANDPEGDRISYAWDFAGATAAVTDGKGPIKVDFPAEGTFLVKLTVSDSLGNVDLTPASIAVNVASSQVNLPPDGSISHDSGNGTTAFGDVLIYTGASIVFKGSAIDPEGNPITYDWDFGSAALPAIGAGPITVQYSSAGVFSVTLTATDSFANVDPAPAQITVTVVDAPVNQPPDGSISHSKGTGNLTITAGESIIFNGAATDPENNPISSYSWDFAGMTASSTSGAGPISVDYPVAGSFLTKLTTTDSLGNIDPTPAEVTVTVLAVNLPPDGSIMHDSGTGGVTDGVGDITITAGDKIVFVGNAIDPESNPVTYIWNFAGMTASSTSSKGPITVDYPTTGKFLVRLSVIDNLGNIDPSPAELVVTVDAVNRAPDGSIKHDSGSGGVITAIGDVSITTGGSVVYMGQGTDPDGDGVSYAWDFNGMTATPSTTVSGPITVDYPVAGIYTAKLTVTDSFGNVDQTPAEITVIVADAPVNLPPDGSIQHDQGKGGSVNSVGDISITRNDSIVFIGSASDPEKDTVSYAWDFGVAAPTKTGAGPITVNYPTTGSYIVLLTVTDSFGNVDIAPAKIAVTVNEPVVNQPPNGLIAHDIAPGSGSINVTEGDTVNFSATATDPESNAVTFAWDFGTVAAATTGAGPIPIKFTAAGAFNIVLTATDSLGLSDPTPATITVTVAPVNQPPDGSISHDIGTGSGNVTITNGDSINFTGSAFEPEGNGVSYAWDFGTVAAPATTPGPITVNYPDTGTFEVLLTATDSLGNADKTPAKVIVTVTQNQAPESVISHNIGTGRGNITITAGDTVAFTGNGIDPENNLPIVYNWDFGVASQDTASQGPISVSYPEIGTYTITLTTSDSRNNVDQSPATITVVVDPVNQPPNVSLQHDNGQGPSAPLSTATTIEITVGSIVVFSPKDPLDPDGDPIIFDWTFGGGISGSNTGSSPKTVQFPTVDTYVVRLTVSDTFGNVDQTPAEVVVKVIPINQPPFGSTITHDNGSGATGSVGNISLIAGGSVIFNGSATDPEGFALNYSWDFGLNAQIISGSGNGPIEVSFPSTEIALVTLTVTDNQGLADPSPATLMVNVRRTLPAFQNLPVLAASGFNPTTNETNYTINVDNNVSVNVVTPDESWTTPMMRYNSLQLPPVIKAKRGDKLILKVINNLTTNAATGFIGEETTVHWHGFKIRGDVDGGPDFPIAPGDENDYIFTLNQPAASLWFHPHADGTTATQVYNGLAGAFVITDEITDNLEAAKQLPKGIYDIPLMIQDRLFNSNVAGQRALIYLAMTGGMGAGMLGDRILVNGVQLPGLKVDTRQYRFRLYNGSNARSYDFALSNNATFMVVGTDGGLLNKPVASEHVKLGAGERAEIVVDFRGYTIGEDIMLVSRAFNDGNMGGMGGGGLQNGTFLEIMRFDVTNQAIDDVTLYTSLPLNPDINARLTKTDITAPIRPFVMSEVMKPGVGIEFRINDKTFTLGGVPEENIALNATEIWDITNITNMAHPFHAHAIQWQILSRGQADPITGATIPGSEVNATGIDLGWKDTVLVQPGESVQFIGRFDPLINTGLYMYHCHILEHEDNGMMGMFQVGP